MSEVSGYVVGESPLRIWGLASGERLRRQLERAGAGSAGRAVTPGAGAESAARAVLLRADWVYDLPLVRALVAARDDCALMVEGNQCVALSVRAERLAQAQAALVAHATLPGVRAVGVMELAGSYDDKLRKRELPYLMPLASETLPALERRVFGGAYKGVTDAVTLYLWPAPARAVTRFCARFGVSPNQVTFVSLLFVLAAMWLFWTGRYGWGLVAAWIMTFLDTVDGKLARVTLRSTRFGDIFDHGIDLLHPPFWWWAWIVGLPAAGWPLADPSLVLTVIVAGYVLQRLEEGAFIAWFGMDMHTWQRFDSRFRLVTARRNPNLVILTVSAIAGRPDIGIVAVAVWTALSMLVHTVRLAQGALQRRHGPLRSWLAS